MGNAFPFRNGPRSPFLGKIAYARHPGKIVGLTGVPSGESAAADGNGSEVKNQHNFCNFANALPCIIR
jgi:hypothetical protein